MYCTKCGTNLDNSDGICPNCEISKQMPEVKTTETQPVQNSIKEEKVEEQGMTREKLNLSFISRKRLIPIVFICVILGSIFAFKSIADNNKFHDMMMKAEKCIADDEYEQAISYYTDALNIKSNNKEALNALHNTQATLLQECIKNVKDYVLRGDYSTAYDEMKDLPISEGDPSYKEYQKILSVIKMSPKIESIDSAEFPLVKITVKYEGDAKLTKNELLLQENEEVTDIINSDISSGKAVLTFIEQEADYQSVSRNVCVTISVGGLKLTASSVYNTPALERANMTLVTTDLSQYPVVKAYFKVEDINRRERIENLNRMSFTMMESVNGGKYLEREIKSANIVEGNAGVNISLVADKSDSIGFEDMAKIKKVMTEFVQSLQFSSGDKSEILAFDSIVQQMCTYVNKPALLVNGINNMSTDGMTAFYDAVYAGVNHAALQGGARCVIAFTDGLDNRSRYLPEDVIEYANKNQVPLYIIGVGSVDAYTLEDMANRTNGGYWYIDNLYNLQEIFNQIYQEQKKMYVVEYKSDVSLDTFLRRNLDVKVIGNGYKGECSASFTPTKTLNDDGGVNVHNSRYEIYVEDVSWEEANQKCLEKGGHLVTITSKDEMDKVVKLAGTKNAIFVWMGGYTSYDDNGNVFAHWITGEDFAYSAWCEGEPSRTDKDGVDEWYLMLWNIKNLGGWRWNDQRNDPVADYPYMSGKIAYICEYE